jgi:hypothetical protein
VGCRDYFLHALPRGEGAFDIEKFRHHGYSEQFSGMTLEAVREQIHAARRGSPLKGRVGFQSFSSAKESYLSS